VDTGFPKKIMLKQSDKAGRRFEEKSSRLAIAAGKTGIAPPPDQFDQEASY
jgi:hypothetical protein